MFDLYLLRGRALAHVMVEWFADTASLTLGGVTRSITKVANQGNSAITYKVDDGWPDPTDGKIVTAYAKTGSSASENALCLIDPRLTAKCTC